MATSFLGIFGSVAGALGNFSGSFLLNAIPQGNIGGISVQVTVEETHTDNLQITENPVEEGAEITDHSFKKPPEIVLRCGWSNSTISGIVGSVQSLFSGGFPTPGGFVGAVYSQLIALQESRVPFTVLTSIRQYSNMLISSISLTRDKKTSQVLMVAVTCRQVIIVSTQSATLAPLANMANAASTAENVNIGPVALTDTPTGSAFKWIPSP